MLTKLSIKNFAIIDDITIDFNNGFSALTGQTGSGKSILLQALSLIFGKRAFTDMIRHNSEQAIVSASFKLNKEQQNILNLPQEVLIERIIDNGGRNLIKVNEKQETLSYLKEVTEVIGLIHGQDEQYLLLDKANYLQLLDQVAPNLIQPLLNEYLVKRENYLNSQTKIKTLEKNNELKQERLDYLTFQQEELRNLNLSYGEEEEIENQVNILKHYEKLSKDLFDISNILEEEPGLSYLYNIKNKLSAINEIIPSYGEQLNQVENSYYELEELRQKVNSELSNMNFDQKEYDNLQNRLFEINKLTTKYNCDGNTLVDLLKEITEEIELATNFDSYLIKLKDESEQLFKEAYISGQLLSTARNKIAKEFSQEVVAKLKVIDLPHVKFEIKFEQTKELLTTGIDNIEFYISFNEQEPLKPLIRVASGGEKARFMFAFKTVLALRQNLSLLILDEIDIGISGSTASKMANEMVKLSEIMQLIVITHLPQVSSKANYQYLINKKTVNNRVQTTIDLLTDSERVIQIAHMISDDNITNYAIEQAKSMLKNN